jgi:hypothetical protein
VGKGIAVFVGKLFVFIENALEDFERFGVPFEADAGGSVYGEIVRVSEPVGVAGYSIFSNTGTRF